MYELGYRFPFRSALMQGLSLMSLTLPLVLHGLALTSGEVPKRVRGGVPDAECLQHQNLGYRVLYASESFKGHKLGPEGKITPPEVLALRCMTQEPNAVAWLRDLARSGTMPGQLYALVGLRVLDSTEFERRIRRYTSNTDTVTTHAGDIVISHPVAVIAAGIQSGEYVRELLPRFAHLLPRTGAEWIKPQLDQ